MDEKLEPLTPEQIQNWRKAMSYTLGPYALIMPVDQIEAMRRKMQGDVNKMDKKEEQNGM